MELAPNQIQPLPSPSLVQPYRRANGEFCTPPQPFRATRLAQSFLKEPKANPVVIELS
jgi:hypothetical protein